MGGVCHIGDLMRNISELIDRHEEIFGDQSQRITSLPTMVDLRMSPEEIRKKQKREWYNNNREEVLEQQKNSEKKKKSQKEWYANNRTRCIEKAKNWNHENAGARKLITERYNRKHKGSECQWNSRVN